MRHTQRTAGFTMVELLIVLSVTGILLAVVLASITQAKNKAADADIKRTLNDIQVKVEQNEIAPGVVDYSSAFTSAGVSSTISALASKYGVTASQYQTSSSTSEYAVIFPLKKSSGTYYCVDATRASKNVGGFLNATGPKNCSNVTAPAGHVPVLTLLGDNPGTAVSVAICDYAGGTDTGGDGIITPSGPNFGDPLYDEPGYTATDVEDGDITSRVTKTGLIWTTPFNYTDSAHAADGYIDYSVTDSDGNTVTARRTMVLALAYPPGSCGNVQVGPGGGLPLAP